MNILILSTARILYTNSTPPQRVLPRLSSASPIKKANVSQHIRLVILLYKLAKRTTNTGLVRFSAMRGLNGFTLIELLVVIAIITLLMAILMPTLYICQRQR